MNSSNEKSLNILGPISMYRPSFQVQRFPLYHDCVIFMMSSYFEIAPPGGVILSSEVPIQDSQFA